MRSNSSSSAEYPNSRWWHAAAGRAGGLLSRTRHSGRCRKQRRRRVVGPGADVHRCGHVAIVGRPSVGKSTLLNALVGARISITSRKPQTTRHRVTGILTEPPVQYVFVDTPGFQTRHRGALNERLNRTVRDSLADVDVVVWVLDAARITPED